MTVWSRIKQNVQGGGRGVGVAHTKYSDAPTAAESGTVGRIVGDSREWLNLAATAAGDWTPAAQAACRIAFLADDLAEGDRLRVKKALVATRNGIRGGHNVKLSEADSANYVNIHKNWKLSSSTVTNMQTGKKRRVGEIHISRGKGQESAAYAMMTYIHEATHRYAGTVDYGDQGYFFLTRYVTEGVLEWREAGMTPAQALTNADSYAAFVAEVCKAAGRDFPA